MYNVWRTTVILIVTTYTEFVLYYTMLIVLNKFNSIHRKLGLLTVGPPELVRDYVLVLRMLISTGGGIPQVNNFVELIIGACHIGTGKYLILVDVSKV